MLWNTTGLPQDGTKVIAGVQWKGRNTVEYAFGKYTSKYPGSY